MRQIAKMGNPMNNNRELAAFEPKEVFRYFYDICSIPHGSGNTGAIAKYCLDFAGRHGYEAVQDAAGNVILYAGASRGYEHCRPVALQGHLDMVCDKAADCGKDMEQEGVEPVVRGNYLAAEGTTLGADDGIGIAYILAILSMEVPHPPIEAVFTVDEEIGMLGAGALDFSKIQSKRLINIDSEEEGILTVSCAGGVRAECSVKIRRQEREDRVCHSDFRVNVHGLPGGHSGVEIHKKIPNAIKVLAAFLQLLEEDIPFQILDITGGVRDNSIPKQACALLRTEGVQPRRFREKLEKAAERIRKIYKNSPGLAVDFETAGENGTGADTDRLCPIHPQDGRRIIDFLRQAPDGIIEMSREIPDMVESSLNLGVCRTGDSCFTMNYLIRSNAASGKEMLCNQLSECAGGFGGTVAFFADYPAWEFRKESPLLRHMVRAYEEEYGKKPVISGIHAGLECGIFYGRKPELDMVSFGPTLLHVHTPEEKMELGSVLRTWNYLLKILLNMKD